ncbi:MAG: nucleoside 2-deoxyribosyltransferase domain-containing protein [Minisyncoccia bacterium]
MNYIEAPDEYESDETSLFLAGGITNCPDWQKEVADKLKESSLVIFNPRRGVYPGDSGHEEKQINWEFKYLHKASAISFWFPKETLNPISLFELGSWLNSDKKLFIGLHPDYEKNNNVIIQTKLVRPEIQIVFSLEELTDQIKDWEMGK